uniref:Uncharacterized protein n=1 Tax=Anopheles coluzzii TaxID=1518534 RepID=A0A8W7PNC7_ANOCL
MGTPHRIDEDEFGSTELQRACLLLQLVDLFLGKRVVPVEDIVPLLHLIQLQLDPRQLTIVASYHRPLDVPRIVVRRVAGEAVRLRTHRGEGRVRIGTERRLLALD